MSHGCGWYHPLVPLTAARRSAATSPWLSPWTRWGLRRNPFGEPPPEEAGGLVVMPELDEVVAHLGAAPAALQLLGDAGRGKTARLARLGSAFPGSPYVYLPEDEPLPAVPALVSVPLALRLDEAQRLPRRRRRRLFREAARKGHSLAIASHENLGAELEGAGLAVTTRVVAGLDAAQLGAIVARRLTWASGGCCRLPALDHATAERLVARFGDDLRALLDHLYDIFQAALTADDGGSPWARVT